MAKEPTRPFKVTAGTSIFINKKKHKSGSTVHLTKAAAEKKIDSGHVEVDLDAYFDDSGSKPATSASSGSAKRTADDSGSKPATSASSGSAKRTAEEDTAESSSESVFNTQRSKSSS